MFMFVSLHSRNHFQFPFKCILFEFLSVSLDRSTADVTDYNSKTK